MMRARSIMVLLLSGAVLSAPLHAQWSDALRAELLELGRQDQEVRERFMAFLGEHGPDAVSTDGFAALADEMAAIDSANLARLDEIVADFGWPGADAVGAEASASARIVLLHAPLEKQKEYLPLLRDAIAGDATVAIDAAMLEDDIALADEGRQIYGTNVSLRDGRAMLDPVVDPERLDERRAAVGLPPIEEYLREAERELGMPVDRSALSPD